LNSFCSSLLEGETFGQREVQMKQVGRLLYILGLALTIPAGFFLYYDWVTWGFFVLGGIVGLINLAVPQPKRFLLAGLAFVLVSVALTFIPFIVAVYMNILGYVASFASAALIVTAVRVLFDFRSNQTV
jgi:hypothetical protein